ncbi:MAG: hypothetical protein AAF587_29330 [Bacteroidota bacterium]
MIASFLEWFGLGETYLHIFMAIALLVGSIRFRQLSPAQRLLSLLVMLSVLSEVLVSTKIFTNNMPIFHLYTVGEFCLIVSIFYVGRKDFLPKTIFRILIASFLLVAFGNVLLYQSIWEMNSLSSSIEGIVLVGLALWYFYDLLERLDMPNLGKSFMFWFATGVLLFFVSNLLFFVFSSSIVASQWQTENGQEIVLVIWPMFTFMNILLYLIFSIALICKDSIPSPKSFWSAP